jgi:hypothetical protein
MAHAVSRRPTTAEIWVHARVSPHRICDGNIGTVGFSRSSSVSPVNVIPPWLSMVIYHLGMNNRPVGGWGSKTSYHSIDMNNNNVVQTVTSQTNIFLLQVHTGPFLKTPVKSDFRSSQRRRSLPWWRMQLTSLKSLSVSSTRVHNIPESCNFHTCCQADQKSHQVTG